MLKNQKQPGVKMIELFLFRVLTPQPIIESIQKDMIIDNLVLNIAISVGFAFYPMDGGDYDSLYQVADERMYSCKQKNKNNVPCFEETN